jgi:imidazolonepropionase-like amidohydrolase
MMAFLAIALGLLATPASTRICLQSAEIIDPAAGIAATGDIVVEGERIVAVGLGAAMTCPKTARVDARGLFAVPGLADLHVHAFGNPSPTGVADEDHDVAAVARLALTTGVTLMLDLGGVRPIELRRKLRASRAHAQVLSSGGILHAGSFRDRAVRSVLEDHAQGKPDVVKFIFNEGVINRAIAEARELGLKSVVHIATWDEARAAVLAGADAITHFEDEVVIPADLPELIARRGAAVIPTMAVQCDMALLAKQAPWLDDPLLARVTTPQLRAQYRNHKRYSDKARYWVRWQSEGCTTNDFPSLRRLHEAKVTILAGSDSGNLGVFQGFSLHRELELMVEAGLSPAAALRTATSSAWRFLGVDHGIKPGAPADIVLLRASPLVDIRNTRQVAAVMRLGTWHTPLPAGR